MRNFLTRVLLVFATTLWGQPNAKNGIALQGYDPVAYFTSQTAQKGTDTITASHNGVEYHFVSEENKQLFLNNPSQYEPQFGGYCAYGMSKGYKAPIDPNAFTIVDGKLYLNYNLSVRTEWAKEKEQRIPQAEANWLKLQKK